MRMKKERYDFKLASGSPRRKELLGIAGWRALFNPVEVEEVVLPNEAPKAFAKRLAFEKAETATDEDGMLVLGADTIVIMRDRILGKPQDTRHAVTMLQDLCGRVHQVITAIALVDRTHDRSLVDFCETEVPMRDYSQEEIGAYVESGSPLDKAGAYGIQDVGFCPVDLDRMEGCFANVMGLPLCHLVRSLRTLGVATPERIHESCITHTKYNCQVYKDILQGEI